jgi:NAD(P)-dependent dehydrogenase (short-subunit alcohol dehydrogenase family)
VSAPVRHAIVTGSAHGLGAAIAAHAARAGYRVGLVDVGAEALAVRAGEIPGSVALACDVTDEPAVERALEAFGAVPDLVVCNAGIVRFGPLLDLPVADFRKVLEVNLVGAFIVGRAAARRMAPLRRGAIVNISSVNALTPGPGAGAYPASKAAVANLTQHMALEWGPLGLRVNCVAPGFIDAGMSAPIYANPKIRASRGGAVPMRRLGTAEEIADAVMFLASDAASYVNGHQLVVDGGVAHSVLLQLPRD